jgi:hypothetical protein
MNFGTGGQWMFLMCCAAVGFVAIVIGVPWLAWKILYALWVVYVGGEG